MTYVDTSVLLAGLLSEDRRPPERFWEGPLISSRLTVYETWNRLHAKRLTTTHGEAATALIGRLALVELSAEALKRGLEPFPAPVRTLDSLHLASFEFLHASLPQLKLATYDERMQAAAVALGFPLLALPTSSPS